MDFRHFLFGGLCSTVAVAAPLADWVDVFPPSAAPAKGFDAGAIIWTPPETGFSKTGYTSPDVALGYPTAAWGMTASRENAGRVLDFDTAMSARADTQRPSLTTMPPGHSGAMPSLPGPWHTDSDTDKGASSDRPDRPLAFLGEAGRLPLPGGFLGGRGHGPGGITPPAAPTADRPALPPVVRLTADRPGALAGIPTPVDLPPTVLQLGLGLTLILILFRRRGVPPAAGRSRRASRFRRLRPLRSL